METIRVNKVFLIDTLSTDAEFMLQYVQQEMIITKREYSNLNHGNHTQEKIVTNLLDKVMNKGDEMCCKFVDLLKQDEIQKTFPQLKKHFLPGPTPTSQTQNVPVQESNENIEYKMSSTPRGHCLIINNVNFDSPLKTRYGSNSDRDDLVKVFKWLGFSLDVHNDLTAEQIKDLLKTYSQKNHDGDCFVCCIMSHGGTEGVYGTDAKTISGHYIFGPFSGTSSQSLIGKPKVFFIQACRGKEYHLPVETQADNCEDVEEKMEKEDEESLDTDADPMITLPSEADFLIARSTVKGYVSFRETITGSWFIQSLCKQLEIHCPKGEDVPSILLHVNKEVSEKVARLRIRIMAKQMPVHKVTLRKKLVFRVANQQ